MECTTQGQLIEYPFYWFCMDGPRSEALIFLKSFSVCTFIIMQLTNYFPEFEFVLYCMINLKHEAKSKFSNKWFKYDLQCDIYVCTNIIPQLPINIVSFSYIHIECIPNLVDIIWMIKQPPSYINLCVL